LALLEELLRVVRVGGEILLEVRWTRLHCPMLCELIYISHFYQAWALEQDESSKRKFGSQEVMVPWKLKGVGPDKQRSVVELQRYCHVFRQGEVSELFARLPQAEVLKEWNERSNWCVLVRRRAIQ
jgi:hypothetical protein